MMKEYQLCQKILVNCVEVPEFNSILDSIKESNQEFNLIEGTKGEIFTVECENIPVNKMALGIKWIEKPLIPQTTELKNDDKELLNEIELANTPSLHLKKGDTVEIWEKPITKEILEGVATLVKLVLWDEKSEYWTVDFKDGIRTERWIKVSYNPTLIDSSLHTRLGKR